VHPAEVVIGERERHCARRSSPFPLVTRNAVGQPTPEPHSVAWLTSRRALPHLPQDVQRARHPDPAGRNAYLAREGRADADAPSRSATSRLSAANLAAPVLRGFYCGGGRVDSTRRELFVSELMQPPVDGSVPQVAGDPRPPLGLLGAARTVYVVDFMTETREGRQVRTTAGTPRGRGGYRTPPPSSRAPGGS
jgi:hypothetical protein